MEPYIGEIRLFAGNFAPKDWAFCDGRLLSISSNTALFAILGTKYGGDGKTNFALPNLQGAVPLHHGQGPGLTNYNIGQTGGSETVTLTVSQLPFHTHVPQAIASATTTDPEGAVWANTPGRNGTPIYAVTPNVQMNPDAISSTGNNQPHNNRQPYLGLNYIISLRGEFPPRT